MGEQVCPDTNPRCVCFPAFCDGQEKLCVCVIIVAAVSVETGKANSVLRKDV